MHAALVADAGERLFQLLADLLQHSLDPFAAYDGIGRGGLGRLAQRLQRLSCPAMFAFRVRECMRCIGLQQLPGLCHAGLGHQSVQTTAPDPERLLLVRVAQAGQKNRFFTSDWLS
jgi:hypothetical protein